MLEQLPWGLEVDIFCGRQRSIHRHNDFKRRAEEDDTVCSAICFTGQRITPVLYKIIARHSFQGGCAPFSVLPCNWHITSRLCRKYGLDGEKIRKRRSGKDVGRVEGGIIQADKVTLLHKGGRLGMTSKLWTGHGNCRLWQKRPMSQDLPRSRPCQARPYLYCRQVSSALRGQRCAFGTSIYTGLRLPDGSCTVQASYLHLSF